MYVLLSQVKGWDNSLIEEIDTGNFLAGISPPQTQGFKTLF